MKKLLMIISLIASLSVFSACEVQSMSNENETNNEQTNEIVEIEPIDSLVGTWEEYGGPEQEKYEDPIDPERRYVYYEVVITDDNVSVILNEYGGIKKTRTWYGDWKDPIERTNSYSYTSTYIDEEGTMYNPEDCKRPFYYNNGVLSFDFKDPDMGTEESSDYYIGDSIIYLKKTS